METIKEIIGIVSRNKVEIVGQGFSETKLFKLYELVETGVVNTDQEAISLLYPDAKDPCSAYYKLKYFLRRRLLNTIFLVHASNKHPSTEYVKLLRKLMEVRILAAKGGEKTGVKMAKKIILKAEKMEFWDISVFAARFIRQYYVVRAPDFKQFQKYDSKLTQFLEVSVVLVKAEGFYYQLVAYMIHDKLTNQDLYVQAKKYESILNVEEHALLSVRIDFYRQAITIIKLMSNYEYVEAIKKLNSALISLRGLKEFYNNFHTTYLVNLIACHTYLKQYEEGVASLEKALSYTLAGSFNWTQARSTQVTLAFHSKRYAQILPIYLEVTKHRKFKKIPFLFREIWDLYYAWLYLLAKVNLLELPSRTFPKNFKLDNWLDRMKTTSKDKNGLSINIRIIKTIGWLLDENYNALIDQDDSLKRYRYRYVKNNAQRRANLILRYLINIQNREFVDYKCVYITESAKKSFQELPVELKWANFEIEIVPFDDVVQILSDIMKRNARRIRKPQSPK